MNLRGTKESGTLFAIPTYGFIVAIMTMIAVGLRGLPGRLSVRRRRRRAAAQRRHRGRRRRGVRDPEGLLARRDRAHGRRGDLQRGPRLPSAAGAERRRDARRDGDDRRSRCSWDLVAHDARGRRHRERGRAPSSPRSRSRSSAGLLRGVLRRAGVHRRDPDPRREHGVPGLPATRVDPGARPVRAEAVHEPRRPARVLERRPRPRAPLVPDDLRLRRRARPPDPASTSSASSPPSRCRRPGWSAIGWRRAGRVRRRSPAGVIRS